MGIKKQKLKKCIKCILPETFPGIKFDKKGVCNYCRSYQKITVKGKKALEKILSQYRNKGGKVDCIVTTSGGRDSTFVLYQIVKKYGMKVLAVTYDWGMMTPEAHKNWELTNKLLNIEHIIIKTDTKKIKRHIRMNIKAWLKKPHLGMVPIFTQGDKQAEYYINKLAKRLKIPLIITGAGNDFETTGFKHGFLGVGGGMNIRGVGMNLSTKSKIQLLICYILQHLKNPAYLNSSIIEMAKAYFIQYINSGSKNIKWLHFYHYYMWNEDEMLSTIRKELDWRSPEDTILTWRTDDCTAPFYNYLHYTMAGFTENDTFRSNQIREGVLSREGALKIVKKENRPRTKAIKKYLESLNLSFDDFQNLPKLY